MMKINLELEDAEMIKDFTFDANTPYEQKIAGKGIKGEIRDEMIPDFTGKSVTEAEDWGTSKNITIKTISYID